MDDAKNTVNSYISNFLTRSEVKRVEKI